MLKLISRLSKIFLYLAILVSSFYAQQNETDRSWNQPIEPFKIIDNIYYVGASEITSYLITTPKGHILIDSGFAETVPQIEQNVEKLGFKLQDVKILLNSHAHYDHAGGLAELKRLTGAKLFVSEPDAKLLSNGGKGDPNFGDRFPFESAMPDEAFRDGKTISLGTVSLKANITSGHTPGCTTWSTTAAENGRKYNVIFVCSTSAPGYKLVGNSAYPKIAADYERTFERLEKMNVEVFLGSHGNIFDLERKSELLRSRPANNPFIDPKGFREYLEKSRADFRSKLKIQSQETK